MLPLALKPVEDSALRLGGQGRLPQYHHVVLGRMQRLVDPIQAARHVAGVAGDQDQVADRQEKSGCSAVVGETSKNVDHIVANASWQPRRCRRPCFLLFFGRGLGSDCSTCYSLNFLHCGYHRTPL